MKTSFIVKHLGERAHNNERTIYEYNGRRTEITKYDQDTIDKLMGAGLPVVMHLLHYSLEGLQDFIDQKKRSTKEYLIELLEQQWYWRETGELASPDITAAMLGVGISPAELLKKCKSTRPPSLEIMMTAIRWYTGDKSEVYIPSKL